MDNKNRTGLGVLWLAVAALMAYSLYVSDASLLSLGGIARLVAIAAGVFLAVVYFFDPFGHLEARAD